MTSKTQIPIAIVIIAVGTFCGGAALMYIQRQHSSVEQNRNERREREFSLEDAYKKPPPLFRDAPGSRLYGRVLPHGDDQTVLAAISPQALDSEIADNQKLSDDIRRAQHQYHEAVDSAVAAARTYQSMLPN